jgi:hypothetical protein
MSPILHGIVSWFEAFESNIVVCARSCSSAGGIRRALSSVALIGFS